MKSKPAPIAPLILRLSFIKEPKRWGFPFRSGHIEMTEDDFRTIASAMKARVDE